MTRSPAPVTVVAGPPCSGKNVYVSEHRGPSDLVIDVDALRVALGGGAMHDDHGRPWLPFVSAARDAVIMRMGQAHELERIWIITCAPYRWQREMFHGATVIVLDTSIELCHERAAEARPALWHQLIDQWFNDYEP